jgi:hypothetical protein
VAVVALAGGLAWGAWKVAAALAENSRAMPAEARAVPLKALDLKTDGVLTKAWLQTTLALRPKVSLMELDLNALRARLMATGQVATANLTRRFPDGLDVQITERTPVARVMTEFGGERRPLLVARDGVLFPGAGYDAAMIETLPWLDGVEIKRRAGRLLPLAGMDVVADLLAKARLEAEHLYQTWGVVSLLRLETDREIEVRTREPQQVTIVFAANPQEERLSRDAGFLRQIAKLDYLWDTLSAKPAIRGRIDLSLGWQVPVTLEEIPAPAVPVAPAAPSSTKPAATAARPPPVRFSFDLSRPQPRTQREL